MSTRLGLLAVLLAFLIGPVGLSAAHAADQPTYGAQDIAIEDDGLAEGWEIVYDEVEGTPGDAIAEWAEGVARGSGLDPDDVLLTDVRLLQSPTGEHATLLVVEVDGDPGGFPAALKKAATGEGYAFRAMGHPSRLLVVAAPESIRKAVLNMENNYAVTTLTNMAYERFDAGSMVGARNYADGALAIDPEATMPYAVYGMIGVKEEDWNAAFENFQKAFKAQGKLQPTGRLAMWSYRNFGYALMKLKKPEADKAAAEALRRAIQHERYAEKDEYVQLFVPHYNLACALARLKQTDAALDALENALLMAKERMPKAQVEGFVRSRVMTDEDLASIRDASRFQDLVEKATGLSQEEIEDEEGL